MRQNRTGSQEQTIFEWFDLMRNPTEALKSPGLEINFDVASVVFENGDIRIEWIPNAYYPMFF